MLTAPQATRHSDCRASARYLGDGNFRQRGFTLIEVMIVLGIIGVLAALSVAALGELGARGATQNTASDFFQSLNRARARAAERGTQVYVLVYPTLRRDGSLTGGPGAWFVYEDATGDFLGTPANAADLAWSTFAPPATVQPAAGSTDRLLEATYLEDAPKQNVRFFRPQAPVTTVTFPAPFTAVNASANGCSFCDGARGAIVFTGERQARFIKADGTQAAPRTAGLVLQAPRDLVTLRRFGVVGTSGLITHVK